MSTSKDYSLPVAFVPQQTFKGSGAARDVFAAAMVSHPYEFPRGPDRCVRLETMCIAAAPALAAALLLHPKGFPCGRLCGERSQVPADLDELGSLQNQPTCNFHGRGPFPKRMRDCVETPNTREPFLISVGQGRFDVFRVVRFAADF